ncbi:MAG: ABC transporter ATP-binding protein, partial [Lachnospiraceae bacterium]|nr:ABC transporter ATP-binding protein [Lachnospiraceae bacterium]
RIAIARALKAGKDILILDEGLSALHEEMGQKIEKGLLADKERTVISISHHASREIRAMYDAVIELKEGRIA